MKFRTIRRVAICVISVGISIWGISQRQTYTDFLNESNGLCNFKVAEFPESLMENTLKEMNAVLPNAPFIIRATAMGKKDYFFKVNQQEVLVQQVYQGEEIQVGSKINIVAGKGFMFRDIADGRVAELTFVNEMEVGKEYLIFLEEKVDQLSKKNAEDAYYVMQTLIKPIFGYEDKENTIIDVTGNYSTYVDYNLVKENEFFVTSQNALEMLMQTKHQLLDLYPKEN